MHNGSGQPIHDEQPVVTVDYVHLTAGIILDGL